MKLIFFSWQKFGNFAFQPALSETPCCSFISFQEGKYKRAALQYKKIVSWLEHESGLSDAEETKAKSLRLAAHLNLAMCHLKLKEYSQALENCNKVSGH